jgi:hypothetical protein
MRTSRGCLQGARVVAEQQGIAPSDGQPRDLVRVTTVRACEGNRTLDRRQSVRRVPQLEGCYRVDVYGSENVGSAGSFTS